MTKERKFTPPTSFPAEYVTRDGVKVTLRAKGTGEAPYCGQFDDGNWIFLRGDGSYAPCPAYDVHDLPTTTVQWANDFGHDGFGEWHDSREEADEASDNDRIGVIRREWTEGEPPKYFTEEV